MTYPHGGAREIWRDGEGGAHSPSKGEIRDWGAAVEVGINDAETAAINAVQAASDEIVAQSLSEVEAARDVAQLAAANAQTAARTLADWASLVALTGSVDGEGAEVLDSDGGTHLAASATGYDGAAVNNGGRYSWNSVWSRWVRIGGTGLSQKTDKTVTGTMTRVYEGGRWARSGVEVAQIGSDRRMVSFVRDGQHHFVGDVQVYDLNGTQFFGLDGRWDRCGRGPSVTVGSDRKIIAPILPAPLGLDGRYDRCGHSFAFIGVNRQLILADESKAEEAPQDDDEFFSYAADDGSGETAVFLESRSDGSRVRVSSVGSDAFNVQLDGRENVIWSAPQNVAGAPGDLYFAELAAGAEEHAYRAIPELACWGDSLTAQDWMLNLAGLGTTAAYHNFGKSADTSKAIASRMGALKTVYAVAGAEIPSSGPVSLTNIGDGDPLSKFGGIDADIKGYLADVWGTLAKVGGEITFTRSVAGDAVSVATAEFAWGYSATGDADPSDDTQLIGNARDMTHVFFIGRNNAGQVDIIMSHFRSMIAHIGSYAKRFIVIPYLPGRSEPIGSDAYESRKALLTACLTEWPRNTLDLLPDLIAAHDPNDAQDVADVADGVPPSSLMTDNVHPNAAGRVVVAQSVHEFITSNGVLK